VSAGLGVYLLLASPCVRAASEALERGEFEAAGLRGEACHRHGEARGLVFAAQGWLRAGRLARASLAARKFMAFGPATDRRGKRSAKLVLDAVAEQAGTIRLALAPAVSGGESVVVTAERLDPPAAPFKVGWEELDEGDGASVALEPGTWALTLARPAYAERRIEVTSAAGQVTTVAVDMVAETGEVASSPPKVVDRRRRGWAIAAPAVAVPASAGGAALLAVGLPPLGQVYGDMSCQTGGDVDGCRRPAAGLTERSAGGAALLGAGLGVAVAGFSGLVRRDSLRRRLWIGEAVAGGALAIGGAVLLTYGGTEFAAFNTAAAWDAGRTARAGRFYVGGAGLLGAGLGLAATAGVGLVAEAIGRRRRPVARVRLRGGVVRF
jgi:hypothetical protein